MKSFLTKSNQYDNPLDIFGSAFDNFFKPMFYDESVANMKTDIKEVDGKYQLDIEVPGFEKSDISINLEEGYLSVNAKKQDKNEQDKNHRYLRKECSVSCSRSYYVGDINKDDIKASYNNGMLCLNFPKEEEQKPKSQTIEIL